MIENEFQNIIPVDIEKEVKKSYMEYAMSVIVGRALPDVRDGLKPVHKRILYTMYEANLTPDRAYRKSATTVGDVLGKYHPHGDAAVYETMVRMAQTFSLRYPLVDGHGNFGSVDGDAPAAYRYTEARLSKLAMHMLDDIEKETIDYTTNYDDTRKEPIMLPSRFPNLLVNGSSGIAVGMATNIAPHNLTETINGIVAVIDDPYIDLEGIMEHIKGPDFPTGGQILGKSGIRSAYATGKGKIIMRARATIEPKDSTRDQIIITEIPYQVNKSRLIEKIADLVRDKRVEGISYIRDESDRVGMRIVIELKRDANANVVLNNLYKFTQLQETFSINMLALVNGEPKILNLREMIDHYINFQKEVIVRRTKFDLNKAEARAHIVEGLLIAINNIDEVVEIIKSSSSITNAKERLMERFGISDLQSQAIVDMRLGRLTGLEKEKLDDEFASLMTLITELRGILADEQKISDILKTEIIAIRDKFGDERRSELTINYNDIDIEDLIDEEEVVITLTHFGYIKRLPTGTYKSQHRGGRGVNAMNTREEDFIETVFTASTHDHVMFFTNRGRMFRMKGYQVPEASRTAKGTAIVNLLQMDSDEKITAILSTREYSDDKYILFVTKNGVTKRTTLSDFDTARKMGLIAINLDEGDELIRAAITDGTKEIIVGTRHGIAIKFDENDVRVIGRASRGVRAIDLAKDDYIVGVAILRDGSKLLTVTEKGYGKKTEFGEYRLQSRGGKGIKNYNLSEQTGLVAGIKAVTDNDDIMIITSEGTIIRLDTAEISTFGRVTKGVRVMRLADDISIVSMARTEKDEEESADLEISEDVSEAIEKIDIETEE